MWNLMASRCLEKYVYSVCHPVFVKDLGLETKTRRRAEEKGLPRPLSSVGLLGGGTGIWLLPSPIGIIGKEELG